MHKKRDGEFGFPCINPITKAYQTFYLNESNPFCFCSSSYDVNIE